MSSFTSFAFTSFLLGLVFYESRTVGQFTTSVTTDEFGLTTQEPKASFKCTASDVAYDLDDLCDGLAICLNDGNEFLCDSKACGSTCTFCPTVGASCDLKRPIKSLGHFMLPTTSRYLKLENFSDLQYGLPITQSEFPLLKRLDMSGNKISTMAKGSFQSIPSLQHLDLGHNKLQSISAGTFQGSDSIKDLILRSNSISIIESGAFEGLDKITGITLADNKLTELRSGMLDGLPDVRWISFTNNKLTKLRRGMLDGLSSVAWISFRRNLLSYIEPGTFDNVKNMKYLHLEVNEIRMIQRGHFASLSNLVWLNLEQNKLQSIGTGAFQGLDSITSLILRNNSISIIENGAFRGLDKINGISFTDNNLTELRKGMLDGLSSVRWISFRRNPLTYIEPGTFDNLTDIKYLLLEEVRLDHLEPDMFRGIQNIKSLSTDDYRLCCLFDDSKVCSIAQVSSLDSCTRLMPNTVLRVAMWVLGFGALLGNTMVIFIRCSDRRSKWRSQEQPFFISNLAIADWIMGVFMIIIASVDIYYGEYYFLKAPHWRNSGLCKFAGVIAVLSSESSVFLLTIITVDRFISIMFPFSSFRFHATSARVCVVIMWVMATILSLGPIVIGSFVTGFYGLSDVCIGLPLSVDSTATGSIVYYHSLGIPVFTPDHDGGFQPSWIYSIVLFLGINLICFLFILVCYIVIFIHVKRSSKTIGKDRNVGTPRDQEVKIAIKMAIIVGTDFLCWMPVIIMGILSQTGLVELPVSLYAWSAVFILPINATLNPYLYTFTAFIGQKKGASQKSVTTATYK